MPTKTATPKVHALRSSTLMALVFGEIAHKIKTGRNPFRCLSTITLGYEPSPEGNSTLIQDTSGQWFRLSIEPVVAPTKGIPDVRWASRVEAD